MKAKWIFLAPLLAAITAGACRCGGCGDEDTTEVDALPSSAEEIFELLFANRKKAKIDAPLDAMPQDLELIAASPDPEAWRAWAATQPYTKRLIETPLFRELRMSRAYLALDGLQHQAAQAAALTGSGDHRSALWKGPTAVGARLLPERPPAVLLVKSIDPTSAEVLRFAAAFAMISRKSTAENAKKEVSGIEVRSLSFRDETILFAVFENLLIAGNDAALVEASVALAMKDGDDPASEDPLFPPAETPGIHFRARAEEGSVFPLFGLGAVGISLVSNPAAPAIVRRESFEKSAAASALLRYAPEASFLAVASDVAPSGAMLAALRGRREAALEQEIAESLQPGVAVIMGATASGEATPTPAGVIAFAHATDMTVLEGRVRKVLGEATGKTVSRSILEAYGSAILLEAGGPSAAITKDALLVAFEPERLRNALAAGHAKAPSLADKKGVDLGGMNGGVYVDLDRAASFLNTFYAKALENDGEAPWSEAQGVLGPTFAAIGSGGAAFAKMETKEKTAEGALHVLP